MKSDVPQSFPEAFLDRYNAVFGEEVLGRILSGFRIPRQTWFRINTLKSDIASVFRDLKRLEIVYSQSSEFEDAGWVEPEERDRLLGSELFANGHIYVQGMASQLPVRLLDIEPEHTVLDLAAAPGSKTLQIASLTDVTAEVAAVEIVRKRMFKLQDNLARNGAEHVRVFLQDGTKVWRYRPEHFDRVLLDAPCSSEGRFRLNNDESFRYWSPSKIKEMVRKQRRLLFSAIHSLKPGGKLVYSTCSLSPEENEMAVQHVLDTFGEVVDIEPIAFQADERIGTIAEWRRKALDDRIRGACRLMPSKRMEGFFVCRFVKTSSSNPPLKFK
ncbi:MAG: RsmB/NOP family class I SAM-dependent RNA methyltransferase [Rhodothermales bacterium]|nr:RsmB/NOP family class I SAM-dependent RNA methyltransferase [Rhodothermales bacterium]MDG2015756.1 RsmB/NOP family class I SAM-dependent RNA methyltransferase [Rhodothermales bacterium]HAY36516.1 RNA methyltransferase [Bacteroidota bacterium]